MASIPRQTSSGPSPFVLIVDDDAAQLGEMAEYLRAKGIANVPVSGVTEAMDLLRRERPALVVMDVNMPNMSGVEGAQMMRRIAYDRPIILMSGDVHAVYEANMARLDIFAVISKPVPLPALERHIRAVLGR